jgi:hypothetical protein
MLYLHLTTWSEFAKVWASYWGPKIFRRLFNLTQGDVRKKQ